MSKKLTPEEKKSELKKYKELVLATIDYLSADDSMQIKTSDFDSSDYYKELKKKTHEHYESNRLSTLKQWFRDLTEMMIEERDFKFNQYLKENTGYDMDIFKSYYGRVNTIIKKGKIISDEQFYEISLLVDQLSQTEPVDNQRIQIINELLLEYQKRK